MKNTKNELPGKKIKLKNPKHTEYEPQLKKKKEEEELFFRVLLGSQQIWNEGTEISCKSPAPTHA